VHSPTELQQDSFPPPIAAHKEGLAHAQRLQEVGGQAIVICDDNGMLGALNGIYGRAGEHNGKLRYNKVCKHGGSGTITCGEEGIWALHVLGKTYKSKLPPHAEMLPSRGDIESILKAAAAVYEKSEQKLHAAVELYGFETVSPAAVIVEMPEESCVQRLLPADAKGHAASS
jgi:hypothetical protein